MQMELVRFARVCAFFSGVAYPLSRCLLVERWRVWVPLKLDLVGEALSYVGAFVSFPETVFVPRSACFQFCELDPSCAVTHKRAPQLPLHGHCSPPRPRSLAEAVMYVVPPSRCRRAFLSFLHELKRLLIPTCAFSGAAADSSLRWGKPKGAMAVRPSVRLRVQVPVRRLHPRPVVPPQARGGEGAPDLRPRQRQ